MAKRSSVSSVMSLQGHWIANISPAPVSGHWNVKFKIPIRSDICGQIPAVGTGKTKMSGQQKYYTKNTDVNMCTGTLI